MSTIAKWDHSTPLPPAKPDHRNTRVPKSNLAYSWWRFRMLFESTFAFTMMEPWEKTLLLTIGFILSSLLFSAIFNYLPKHMMIMHERAVYYLYGNQDNESGVDYLTFIGRWLSDSFTALIAPATPTGQGSGVMNEL